MADCLSLLSAITFDIGALPTHGKNSTLNYKNGIGLVKREKPRLVQDVIDSQSTKIASRLASPKAVVIYGNKFVNGRKRHIRPLAEPKTC